MIAFTAHVKTLSIKASDGMIGAVTDLYFDDRTFGIRWIEVDTGTWLPDRKVLLPTDHVERLALRGTALEVNASRKKIAQGPDIGIDRSVSRQMEQIAYGHYGWVPYWSALGAAPSDAQRGAEDDRHLRSADEIIGYSVGARDGSIGHIEELLVDPGKWSIRAFVIDTRNWWPGRKVLLPASRLVRISWCDRRIDFDRTQEQIETSAEYDPKRRSALRRESTSGNGVSPAESPSFKQDIAR